MKGKIVGGDEYILKICKFNVVIFSADIHFNIGVFMR